MRAGPLRAILVVLCAVVFGVGIQGYSQSATPSLPATPPQPAGVTNVPVAKTPAPYESDPKFVAAMTEGKKLSAKGDMIFAIDAYKKANKISGGKCAECLRQMNTHPDEDGQLQGCSRDCG
jgi:hypothetical protein